MQLSEYQINAMGTLDPSCDNIAYSSLGMVAEVGEICDKLAKFVRDEKLVIKDNQLTFSPDVSSEEVEKFKFDVSKEIGDVLWFTAQMALLFGFNLNDIANQNLVKLRSRKDRGVIRGNGDDR